MQRMKGLLANRVNFTNGQYINTKVLNGEGLYYQSRAYQGKPWNKGVVEYRGVFFNLDDDYDFQRLLMALVFSGIIRKEGDHYMVIEPRLRSQLSPNANPPLMQDILLIVNLQGRILRVLNEQDLIEYNHG